MIQLDTHSLLWLVLQPDKLSSNARTAIEASILNGEKIAISIMSLWEIAHLVSRGRILLNVSTETFLDEIEANYEVLPITCAIAIAAATLPAHFPKDPIDRLITATALCADLTLITVDSSILASNSCKLLW